MTNSKSRKTGKTPQKIYPNPDVESTGTRVHLESVTDSDMTTWLQQLENIAIGDSVGDEDVEEVDEEDETSSTFSLQQCIDEFRARRIRRVSTQSREPHEPNVSKQVFEAADEDLINQNRSNKETERKAKPCRNGFCYCFTSDSGEGGCSATQVRHPKRTKRPDSQPATFVLPSRQTGKPRERNKLAETAASKCPHSTRPTITKLPNVVVVEAKDKSSNNGKCNSKAKGERELKAISRLETTDRDAPLIHIIQKLHNDCVVSEVRVNRDKMLGERRCRSVESSPRKAKIVQSPRKAERPRTSSNQPEASAPPLDCISEMDTTFDILSHTVPMVVMPKGAAGVGSRPREAGRLLEKRLSRGNIQMRPCQFADPPPKPPRRSAVAPEKDSVSSLASTSSSVREAEKLLDEFLRDHGIPVPGTESAGHTKQTVQQHAEHKRRASYKSGRGATSLNRETQCNAEDFIVPRSKKHKRMSYPLTRAGDQRSASVRKPLPSCPSLSDIEGLVESKKDDGFAQNMCHSSPIAQKAGTFGWKQPAAPKLKSQATQANLEHNIGWQAPPKIDLDTVDGVEKHNFASNLRRKDTPIKAEMFGGDVRNKTQKFIWGEQLRQMSPWPKGNVGDSNAKDSNGFTCCSRSFLRNSKRKLLRLVSPKKDNGRETTTTAFAASTRTRTRNIGVQTSPQDTHSYEPTPQSPVPDSYTSAAQSSQQSQKSRQSTCSDPTQSSFDFSRAVRSPPAEVPKKGSRFTQRRLDFAGKEQRKNQPNADAHTHAKYKYKEKDKTYRSYRSEWDQDVALSKMGCLLSNIRARLEASDERAIRTFQEVQQRERQAEGYDCTDGARRRQKNNHHPDPIYSEIEEDSLHIVGSPHIENRTGVEHFVYDRNPEVLYAKVNKPKHKEQNNVPTALGQFIQEALNHRNSTDNRPDTENELPPLPDPPTSEVSYSSPTAVSTNMSHSLNNIRVQEHNSPPRNNRNLSKSDLSLHRSEIFLENLCCGEIVVDGSELERLEKVDNRTAEAQQQDDTVSYVMPNDEAESELEKSGSDSEMGAFEPIATDQSTPKKAQIFVTKPSYTSGQHSRTVSSRLDHNVNMLPMLNQSSSCPPTPCKLFQSADNSARGSRQGASLQEMRTSRPEDKLSRETAQGHLQRLTDMLRKSYRRSKKFLKKETARLSVSLNIPGGCTGNRSRDHESRFNEKETMEGDEGVFASSSLNLDALFDLDESSPVEEQLVRAVAVFRQLPELETSPEMVEAERLLLFSALRNDVRLRHQASSVYALNNRSNRQIQLQQTLMGVRLFVDEMRLPVRQDASQDIFFNYFYICTFHSDGVVCSTQSVECRNKEALFRDCGIEFYCENPDTEVRCEIFMLRLRKVSALPAESQKRILNVPSPTPSQRSSSSSSEHLISRFRLHAVFMVRASDFMPYELVESESRKGEQLVMRASRTLSLPLQSRRKITYLERQIELRGRAEVRQPKQHYAGFLNVQNPNLQHDWNRRWCTLDNCQLNIWPDVVGERDLDTPLLQLDMATNVHALPLAEAPRELCARPRSFCLQCNVSGSSKEPAVACVFFAAETPVELEAWLQQLNDAFAFIATWLQGTPKP